jgi:hypothetical protein
MCCPSILTLAGNPTWGGMGSCSSFSFIKRERGEKLPELLRTGMKTSNLWKEEEEIGGLAITNCLSLYMPERRNEDALLLVRVGYKDGWNLFDMFGFGDPIA